MKRHHSKDNFTTRGPSNGADLPHALRRSAAPSTLPRGYDDFLYAPIGEDGNGMPLTVLSALARLNVDPWEAAADLSRLPEDAARRQFTSMIAALPGHHATLADPAAISRRLIARLPHRAPRLGGSGDAVLAIRVVSLSPTGAVLLFTAFYVAMMFFGQWMAPSRSPTAQDRGPTSSVPSTPSRPPSPPSD
jgi:hypothetical protein